MIAWWWILIAVVVALPIGFYVGMRGVVLTFNNGLKDKNSTIRRMLDPILEAQDRADVEMYAHGAELYDEKSHCLLRCGSQIAKMFRDVEAQRQSTKKGVRINGT